MFLPDRWSGRSRGEDVTAGLSAGRRGTLGGRGIVLVSANSVELSGGDGGTLAVTSQHVESSPAPTSPISAPKST